MSSVSQWDDKLSNYAGHESISAESIRWSACEFTRTWGLEECKSLRRKWGWQGAVRCKTRGRIAGEGDNRLNIPIPWLQLSVISQMALTEPYIDIDIWLEVHGECQMKGVAPQNCFSRNSSADHSEGKLHLKDSLKNQTVPQGSQRNLFICNWKSPQTSFWILFKSRESCEQCSASTKLCICPFPTVHWHNQTKPGYCQSGIEQARGCQFAPLDLKRIAKRHTKRLCSVRLYTKWIFLLDFSFS